MNNERSPWNMAEFYNDENLIDDIRKLYWLRMNLIPHIHSELNKSIKDTTTLMKHLIIDYPDDSFTHMITNQHIIGNLLVVPVLEEGMSNIFFYLPKGTWVNIFTNERYEGNKEYSQNIDVNQMLVFILEGDALVLSSENLFDKADNSLESETLYVHAYGLSGEYRFISDNNDFTITWENNDYTIEGNHPSKVKVLFINLR